MSNITTEVYFNKVAFCLRLKKDVPSLDLNKSICNPFFTYFTEDGKTFNTPNIPAMMQSLNDNFNTNYVPNACTNFGTTYTISTQHGEKVVKVIDEPVVIIPTEDVVIEEELVIEEEEELQIGGVDWDWIDTLQNKKFDKIKLDEYAEKEFNINLKRNMTLPNMIADFKEQLAK